MPRPSHREQPAGRIVAPSSHGGAAAVIQLSLAHVLTDEAATLLAAKLKTPLQIGHHLVRAFEAGFEIGAKPMGATMLGERFGRAAEIVVIPVLAVVVALIVFGAVVGLFGVNPLDLYAYMYQGAFGTFFSWQNTLTRAAPLILTALCTALPAQLGMVVIGGEGALVMGGLCATAAGLAVMGAPPLVVQLTMAIAGMAAGGAWIAFAGALRHYRGVNETISTSGWRTSPAPTGSPSPVMTFSTPGGKVSAASSIRCSAPRPSAGCGISIWSSARSSRPSRTWRGSPARRTRP